MSRRRWPWWRFAATLAVVLGGLFFLYRHRADLDVLTRLSLPELAALVASVSAFFVVSGWIFYRLVQALSVELSAVEWFGLTVLTNALNYLGPARPGVVLKAVYLKSRSLPYAHFSAVVAAGFFLSLWVTGVAGLAVLAVMALGHGPSSPLLAAACGAVVLFSSLPFLVPMPPVVRGGRLGALLDRALQGFREIRRRRGTIAAVGTGVLLQHLISAASCLISFRALGFDLDVLTALVLGIFVALSNVASFTPNNIGLQELVMAYLYASTGMDFTHGLLGAGLIRGVHLLVAFGLAPVFAFLLPRAAGLRLAQLLADPDANAAEPAAGEG